MNGRKNKRNIQQELIETVEQFDGKIPPNAEDLEAQILGAILIDNDVLNEILQFLNYRHFYKKSHSIIFQAIIQLNGKNEPIDAATLKEELQRMNKLNDAGGVEYIIDLTSNVSSSANSLHHARIIFEKYILRKLISISGQITTKCFDRSSEALNILNEAEQKILEISDIFAKKPIISVKEDIEDFIATLQKQRENKEMFTGVRTGYFDLDDLTLGFQKSELIIIAGRPSHGKTAIALNIARNACVKYNYSIAFFSLEMAARELFLRLLASEAMVNGQNLKTGKLKNEDWAKVASTYPNLKTNLFIDDSSEMSILELRAKTRRLKQEHDIDMIMVDYLQLISGQGNFERRDLEVAYISRSLKALAKELDIPVVACAQLNRGTEQRGKDSRPQLSDLRESGSIEQDADVVMFIHRPIMSLAKKLEKDDPDYIEKIRDAELIIRKQRNGPIGDVKLLFRNEFAKFENVIKHPVIDVQSSYESEKTPF